MTMMLGPSKAILAGTLGEEDGEAGEAPVAAENGEVAAVEPAAAAEAPAAEAPAAEAAPADAPPADDAA
jgi:hypothetical protein